MNKTLVFLLIVAIVQLGGCSAENANTSPSRPIAAEKQGRSVRMSLHWEDEGEGLVLKMSLTNTGTERLVFDRELVLGFNVYALDRDGFALPLEEVGDTDSDQLPADSLKSRLLVLNPGENASRRIDLVRGFRVFSSATSSDEGSKHYQISAYESQQKLPEASQPEKIRVAYENSYIFLDGFMAYTGVSASSVGLFDDKAHAEIPMPMR